MAVKKILLIILDGMADRPVAVLGSKTPLQAANTPNMDWFAKNGMCGQMDPIAPGVRPGSDTSHLAILGYNPHEVYTGRGPFEAAGVGLPMEHGDIAFRCNFGTIDADGTVRDRRAGRIRKGTSEIARDLDGMPIEGVKVIFKEATEHRAVLILRGDGLSPKVTDVDPHAVGVKYHECEALEPEAGRTAEIVNEFVERSREILADHEVNKKRLKEGDFPANIILPRGSGVFPHLDSLEERFGIRSAAICGVTLIKGICRVAGMKILDVDGATGGLDTDMIAKGKAAIEALESYDFVFLNVKAPDICGHDGDPEGKVKVAERLDMMMSFIRKELRNDVIMAVTSDHSTPVSVRDHAGDSVPLIVYGKDIRVDEVSSYDEISVTKGILGRIRGSDLIHILLDQSGRAEKFGS
ncbi:MAG: 2,3-bisphosphoglycerate-independent phosphoglycerate mutase [Thermoplasmata archaeon]|nr:2,3-bisphosphoglycerate-independent phosphoglycerate mutase [Thermoplasmata archaeon]